MEIWPELMIAIKVYYPTIYDLHHEGLARTANVPPGWLEYVDDSNLEKRLLKNSVFIPLLGLSFLTTQNCWPYKEQKNLWDPVFIFQVAWILNVGLPDARLSVDPLRLRTFYLEDGNVLVGKAEVDTESFLVIKIGQDLAEEIPAGENVLVFKKNIRHIK